MGPPRPARGPGGLAATLGTDASGWLLGSLPAPGWGWRRAGCCGGRVGRCGSGSALPTGPPHPRRRHRPNHALPLAAGDCPGLLERLAMLPDPRDRRDGDIPGPSVVAVSAAAMLAGTPVGDRDRRVATEAPRPIFPCAGYAPRPGHPPLPCAEGWLGWTMPRPHRRVRSPGSPVGVVEGRNAARKTAAAVPASSSTPAAVRVAAPGRVTGSPRSACHSSSTTTPR